MEGLKTEFKAKKKEWLEVRLKVENSKTHV